MIKRLLVLILTNAAALYIAVQALHGDFAVTGDWKGYVIAALIFALLNSIVKPILKVVALPFVFLTAGLFSFVINMAMVWVAEYALTILKFDGVALVIQGGWLTYLYAGIIMSIANMLIHWIFSK